MAKLEKITYKDLVSESFKSNIPINWRKPSGEISRIKLPSKITGTQANVVVLSPENFPTCSANDGAAYFNVKYMIDNKKTTANTIEVLAFDSAIASYAWACSIMGVKCIIKTPENTNNYWIKKAQSYGAKIEFEGVKMSDASRILDSNRKKTNFISDTQSVITYIYHSKVTSWAITKAVEGLGNGRVVLLSYPVSSGGFSGASFINKKNFPYSKNILSEPVSAPVFYSTRKGRMKLANSSNGFIPYIHNIMGTDYVMLSEDKDIYKTLKCIEQFHTKIANDFKIDLKDIKQLVGKFGPSTICSLISVITMARQLHLNPEDNVVVIGEDGPSAYKDILKNYNIEEMDVSAIIKEAFIDDVFRPIIDVTGQRQRERLIKKKTDFWLRRGANEDNLEKMNSEQYWSKLLSSNN